MPGELIPLTSHEPPVTYLPKFTTDLPFFYLTKQREQLSKDVDFQSTDSEGRPLRWRVSPNRSSHIGVPGIEAHEVWVKLIKPAIDRERSRREGKIYPLVPLGSVNSCLKSLGWDAGGWQQQKLLRCIRQIGYAACEADFWLPTTAIREDGKQLFRHIKGGFTRMSLYAIGSKHLTDDELKSGRVDFEFDLEDTVYVQLHPLEVLIQQSQPLRPVDNEYLFSVSPAERRWLELLQPLFFGVTNNPKHTRGYCDIRYSWYIKHHHTLKRHTERKRVVQQMNELIKDHRQFGYVSKVEYIPVYDEKSWFGSEKNPVDFVIRYYPGKGAMESNKRIKERIKELQERDALQLKLSFMDSDAALGIEAEKNAPDEKPVLSGEAEELLKELLVCGLSLDVADEFVRTKPDEAKRQLEYLPFRSVERNRAGMLRRAIEGNWSAPDGYEKARRKKNRQEVSTAERRKREAEIETELRAEEEALNRAEAKLAALSPDQYEALYQEVKASIVARMPRLRSELENPSEAWRESIRAQMIRRLLDF